MSLWIPILVSAVLVFVMSSVIHMVLGYHNNDFRRLPDEQKVMDALRPFGTPPGEYVVPFAGSMKVHNTPEFTERLEKGPVAMMTVYPNGRLSMGSSLAQWFVYSIVVSVIAAYVTSRAVGAGGDYLQVFRFAGVTAFTGYSIALAQNSIWYRRSWVTTLKSMFDGFIYALLTAGAFGWLWPS
jgi:hypothetical protein